MNNYFIQASVNLKEILKNPGIWDPFILSYVEVNIYPELPRLIKKYTNRINVLYTFSCCSVSGLVQMKKKKATLKNFLKIS